jgi:starch-binding outer membrane protein SusE/F
VQADVEGNNFSKAFEVTSTQNLASGSISVGDLNKKLLAASLEYDVAAKIQFRVASIISTHVDTVYSNTVTTTITPYATTFPPIYMCGGATGGWDWNSEVEMRSIAPSTYYTIAKFINGGAFRFFAQQDWGPTSYNFPWFTTVDSDLENAVDGDSNFKVVGATGYYAITVNLKTKTVVMEPVAEPQMFMTGAGVGGWDWNTSYVQMVWKSNGMYEATNTHFVNGGAFRFFAQKDWNPTSYNFPYFAGGTISPLLENAADGDSNFKFVGATGNYNITLNMLDKIITVTAYVAPTK